MPHIDTVEQTACYPSEETVIFSIYMKWENLYPSLELSILDEFRMTEAMPGKGIGLLFAARLRLGSSSAWTIFGGSRVVLELWIKLDI